MRLHAREFKPDTPNNSSNALVILHGLLGSSANWQSVAKRLAQKRSVYVLDLRNHGQSPWSDAMSYALMAQDVAEFILKLDHSQVQILGHSMGGKVAMHLALNTPDALKDKLNKLIIADIAPIAYPKSHHQEHHLLLGAMLGLKLSDISSRKQADDLLKINVLNDSIRGFLLHNIIFDATHKTWSWQVNLRSLIAHLDSIAGFAIQAPVPFTQPCLMIHGLQSDYVQDKDQEIIHALFPQVSYAPLQAGHWLHVEQATAFTEACETFIS